MFRCVVASMGLLFFDGFHCCFVHENFYFGWILIALRVCFFFILVLILDVSMRRTGLSRLDSYVGSSVATKTCSSLGFRL